MNVVEAIKLEKYFKDFWRRPKVKAVDGITFSVKKGEVFGLLGPNGSGKSTTIKMLLGLLFPTQGVVSIFGREPEDLAVKSRLGYLPEETDLFPYLTAYETLQFFGALFKLPAAVVKKRARELLEMVGLDHAADRRVGEFSKGMARRIGLAQALINDPDLLILDEPTSGLDPIGCREVKDLIAFLKSQGKTIILCSHHLADVQEVCDRAVIMFGGKVRAEGTIEELLVIPDQTQITTPELSPELTERVLEILNSECGEDSIRIKNPQKNLERYFLDVVEQARAEHIASAGAGGAGKFAGYLGKQFGQEAAKEPKVDTNLLAGLVKKEVEESLVRTEGGSRAVNAKLDKIFKKEENGPSIKEKHEMVNKNLQDLL